MTTLLIFIAAIFVVFVTIDSINESKEYKKWLHKAIDEYDATPKSFIQFYDWCLRHPSRDGTSPAHRAYLMVAEEWYDINCK